MAGAKNIEASIVACVEEAGAEMVDLARRMWKAGSLIEYETTEWECVPVGFYWSVHGRPKWKYIVVEKSV